MRNPLVSAIIPNYNYSHFLGQAIDSVLAQTYPDIEILVVDDGSSDGSRDVLDGFGDRIKVIYQQNQGVAAARNNGVQASRGSFVAFLDADDVWLPTKIEKQSQAFTASPELGTVHVGVVEVDAKGHEIRKMTNGLSGVVAEDLLRLDRAVILGGGSGILVRRNVFDAVGGFDIRMSTSADWDFFYRASSDSPVGFLPEILLKYRVHGSNMHSNVGAMERDVHIGFEKAFASATPELEAIRDECYGNFHLMLAGSYFQAGKYPQSIKNAGKSLWYKPSTLRNLLGFPARKLKKA
jgi:glycosyltransferase involved in cell wall biosynthesis